MSAWPRRGALRAAGVAAGDFVAVAMERSLEQLIAILGAMAAGACPCPLEPRLADEETARRVAEVGLAWMLHDPAHAGTAAASGLPAARLLPAERLALGEPAWAQALAPDAPALLLFTSGSTGHPKGVLLSHRGLMNNARGVLAHSGLTPDDRLLHVMPLHHTNALNNQVFTPLLAGACVAWPGASAPRTCRAAGALAPHHHDRRADHVRAHAGPGIRTRQPGGPALRALRLGADHRALHRRIEAFLGCPLLVSYGLSEATCTSTMNPPGARRVGTVGTVLAGQRVVLRQPDAAAPAGGEGRDLHRGRQPDAGYLGAQGQIGVADGRLRTGDVGRFDADGYLTITGRIKDVIIRGGENISPALVEGVVAALPGVAACCVVGAPDADLGEVPVVFATRAAVRRRRTRRGSAPPCWRAWAASMCRATCSGWTRCPERGGQGGSQGAGGKGGGMTRISSPVRCGKPGLLERRDRRYG